MSRLRQEKTFYSRIFRPITTARLQVVAEKSGMYRWGDFFCKLDGNEAKFGHAVNLWVGIRIISPSVHKDIIILA